MALKPLPPSFHRSVRERLRARADQAGLEGLLLLSPGNLAYATSWHFSVNERPMGLWIPVEQDAVLMVPHLELENAQSVPGVQVRTYEEFPGDEPPPLWMIGESGARRMAIDVLDARFLGAAETRLQTLMLADPTQAERAVKHPEELALIREAARFADLVLERVLSAGSDIIRAGGTEADLLADCTSHVRDLLVGAHGAAFQGTKVGITASVHSGPRAALPHGAVTQRRPRPGETIIAGIGCHLGGYHAESGATFVLGAATEEQHAIMGTMAAASSAARDALREGMTCSQVNERALAPIRGAGFGDAIRHRIGHGMGVDGHEAPWLAPGDHTPVAPGMVFSCEPGIYRSDQDGWRTIDTLIVGDQDVEVASSFLTRHPPERRILPY